MNSCRVVAELGGAECDDDALHHYRHRHLCAIKALAFNIVTSYTSATSRSAVMGGKTCSCCSESQHCGAKCDDCQGRRHNHECPNDHYQSPI